jgi:hypothetical protein
LLFAFNDFFTFAANGFNVLSEALHRAARGGTHQDCAQQYYLQYPHRIFPFVVPVQRRFAAFMPLALGEIWPVSSKATLWARFVRPKSTIKRTGAH